MRLRLTIHTSWCVFLLSCVSLDAGQARNSSIQRMKTGRTSATPKESVDVCALLTSEEIEAAQGEPIKETRATMQPSGGMLMSRCTFLTPTLAKSVSLEVATVNPANSGEPTPREYWRNQFHPRGLKEEELPVVTKTAKKTEDEGEMEVNKGRSIHGLGREAYWVGNRIAGALYALQGDVFLRISIGGVREESARIEKSKALARAAVNRLRASRSTSRNN